MDITQWYGVALGGLAALFVVFYKVFRHRLPFFFIKHIFYPQVHQLIRGPNKTTRFEAVLIVSFLIGNVLCTTIGIKGSSDLVNRTALVSIINLVPIFLGGRVNIIISYCEVRYEAYSRIHLWVGRVAIAECIVHSAVALASQRGFHGRSQISGLIGVSLMASILFSSTKFVKQYFYEIFAKLHLVVAPLAIVAIWLHIPSKDLLKPPKLYLLVAASLYGLVAAIRLIHIVYRNFRLNVAEIKSTNESADVVTVHLTVSRPWKYRAGQYIYICIPGASYTSFLQLHPFYVFSWDKDTILLLVERRRGFTAGLLLENDSPNGAMNLPMKAIIEGPYGKELRLESYGTVLLFATGIGIAAQLPFIRQLLEGYQNRLVKARRIALFWEIDSEMHRYWAGNMMNDFLSLDIDFILDIHVFIRSDYISAKRKRGDITYTRKENPDKPNRITYHYYPLNAESQVRSEIEKPKRGETVISRK